MDEKTFKKARSRVLRLLTYRARSAKEVTDYLKRKGYEVNVAEAVLKEMKEYGYIEDYKFASDFISYRKMNGQGVKKVRFELQMKGVRKQVIDELISEMFDSEEDLLRIRDLLAKRMPCGDQIDQRWVNRQIGYLKRKGFQDELILKALKDYDLSE